MNETPSQDPADDDTLAGVLRSTFKKMLQGIDGMLPAVVMSYDRTANTATVRPLIQVVSTSGQGTGRAQVAQIPVLALGGGGYVVNFPLKAGDLGWIEASDRDISLYMQAMSEQKPNTARMHSFSDGRFIPDVFRQYTINGEDTNAMVIQTLDGATRIAVSQTAIKLTAADSISLKAASAISMEAPTISIAAQTFAMTGSGAASINVGSLSINGQITLNGRDWNSHQHTGVQPGGGTTGGIV